MTRGEQVFLGECPIIRPEGIYYGGRRVIALAPGLVDGVGVGDVGDLLAYRQEWEPFIKAHLDLWRDMNTRFENAPLAAKCPPGIFTAAQIPKTLNPAEVSFCAALSTTRMMVSDTDPRGILPRWNAWKDKSSADILIGASAFLSWLQSVVLQVAGTDKDRLVTIAQWAQVPIQLPDVPTFSTQQDVIARIQGAYVATKGALGIIGYGAGETIKMTSDVGQAVAQGLSDTARQLPQTTRWIGIAVAVTAVVVAGALIVYYKPRKQPPAPTLAPT